MSLVSELVKKLDKEATGECFCLVTIVTTLKNKEDPMSIPESDFVGIGYTSKETLIHINKQLYCI